MFGDSFDLLRARTAVTPTNTAVIDTETDEHWRYRDLDDAVDETARALASREIAGTKRLGIAMQPSPQFVVAVYATIRLGWQVVPLDPTMSTESLASRIDRTSLDLCLCCAKTEQAIATAAARASASTVSVDEPQTAGVERLFATTASVDFDPPDLDDTILILFTSGTTGTPKGVRLTIKNVLASSIASALRLGVQPDDRWLCCLPMYHMGGLAPVFRTVLYGIPLVVQPSFNVSATSKIIDDYRITGVSLVPTQLKRLLDAGQSRATLRTVLLGGAPASESLLARAREAAIPVYPTYGLTETASQVATATPQQIGEHPGTVGYPLFGTEVYLVANDEELPSGQQGEIVVDGPTVTPGYLDESATADAFCEFGFRTGDLGYTDDAGRLWVVGRRDDTIITGGELVAPATVVDQLERIPAVTEAAVIGVNDPEWGQRVVAVISHESTAKTERELKTEIIDHCREHLAGYQRPKQIEFVETIPRTQSGTVDREAVRALLA